MIQFTPVVFIGFVSIYDGLVAGFLVGKLRRYRAPYRDSTVTGSKPD